VSPDVTVPYGDHPDQVIDLHLPPDGGGPAAVVIFLHGGFWRPEYDRTHARPLAGGLVAAGHLVAMPEYRRVGWPGLFDDVAAGVDRALSLVGEYGGDPSRVVLMGHSAGGHLALWTAARHRLPPASPWHRPPIGHTWPDDTADAAPAGPGVSASVVGLAACSSLELCAEWGLDGDAAVALLGGGPLEVPERYALADPAALAPLGVPVTLVHGTADDRVPVEMSRRFAAGAPGVTLVELPGEDHFAVIDPLSAAWPAVLAALTGA
jgi:acetyl esterase/lipase